MFFGASLRIYLWRVITFDTSRHSRQSNNIAKNNNYIFTHNFNGLEQFGATEPEPNKLAMRNFH